MGKQQDIIQGRNEGMVFALRIAKEKGIEELEKEIQRRNISGINARLTHQEIDDASLRIKRRVLDTVLAMSCITLRDEFGFGNGRLTRFKKRFSSKSECIMEGYDTWNDLLNTLREETDIQLEIRKNGDY